MRNILNIIRYDLRKCTSSIVAIITIMGLCIIPCLYAWFNIFSNWAPYEVEATGRISVAVANEDKGAETLGLKINVGDKIVTGLAANDAIGWVFLDSADEAVDGVCSGDYYAALVIPEDFSSDVLSFVSGNLENPRLRYYENEKKNAIAPKITGKARTAVQEQVNATFVETLAGYVSDAVSVAEATGLDPQKIMGELSDKIALLSDRLDDCMVMLDAASSLSDAAQSLLEVSGTLTDSAGDAVKSEKKVLDSASTIAPEDDSTFTKVITSADKINSEILDRLTDLDSKLGEAAPDMDVYNKFVEHNLSIQKKVVGKMVDSTAKATDALSKLGLNILASQFADLNADLAAISEKLDRLETANEENWEEMQKNIQDIRDIISGNSGTSGTGASSKADAIDAALKNNKLTDLDKKLKNALKDTNSAISDMQASLSGLGGMLGEMGGLFDGFNGSATKLDRNMDGTRRDLLSMKSGLDVLSELLARAAGDSDLSEASRILSENSDKVASYLASPVKMKTEVIYPISGYGSAMAPFYTVLAQWVGALLTAVLIKVRVKERNDLPKPDLIERYFGRFGLYLFVGLAQALIVSLGDLLYVGIQCLHPVMFVLEACVNGICFMMINYALVFALDNIGLAAGVIVLVLQVAGSGGTYPVEVLPHIFRVLYPAMPFRYAMDAMRECIGGTYDHTYIRCLGTLMLFALGSVIFGLLLYRPALLINNMITESKKKSEIML